VRGGDRDAAELAFAPVALQRDLNETVLRGGDGARARERTAGEEGVVGGAGAGEEEQEQREQPHWGIP
jgi:hypothetical protein